MNETIQIITSILQTGVITFVVYMIIKGLKTEIKTLQSQVSTQNKTIETMDKRIQETEKIGELYKKLISDFPQAIDDYQQIITKTKDKTIFELKSTLEEKDLTIDTLREQSKNLDPKKTERAAAISKLFLIKENKSLLEFLEKLNSNKDLIINNILEYNDFNTLLEKLDYKVEIIDGFTDEFFNKDFLQSNNVRTSTLSDKGIYMLTFDNILRITKPLYESYCNSYNNLN